MCVIGYTYIPSVHAKGNLEMEEDKMLDGKHAIEEAMSTCSLAFV